MVSNVSHHRAGSIDLFEKDHASQLVRQCHGTEPENHVTSGPDRVVEPEIPAHHERDPVRVVIRLGLEPTCELQRIELLPPLIEYHHSSSLRDCLQQPLRLGADYLGVTAFPPTAFRFDLDHFDRKKVPNSSEVAIDCIPELDVRS